ncbi:VanZ family protein [Desulfogranum japonicum]|uniref:VanZ family protein n=1 Tax=Desulfogranum japonicum TaxID=231447 RepID=UPI0004101673|nr:VanZ family protein [Desulfogranum japonicum]
MSIRFDLIKTPPMMIIMGVIFFLSHQTGDTIHLPSIPGVDKLLHAIAYTVLGLSYAFAFPDIHWSDKPRKIQCTVILLCLLYGISDELHQAFVPGRMVSGADLVADAFGGIVAASVYPFLYTKIRRIIYK